MVHHGDLFMTLRLKTGHHIVGPGQSGHFLSDNYDDQIEKWVKGEYTSESIGNIPKDRVLELVPGK